MTSGSVQGSGLRHEAFFYADDEEFLAGVIPFLEEGLSAGEAVVAVLPEPRLRLLKEAWGPTAREVELQPIEETGRNPGRLISAWGDVLRASDPEQGVRGLGEPVWGGRSDAELEECERHERLLNLAFGAERTLTFMCPYDAGALEDEVLAAAERSHSHLCDREGRLPSPSFSLDAGLEGSLPKPDRPAATLCFGKADLRLVRRAVSDLARSAGLDMRRNEDLALSVCEVATNSIQHGGGEGSLAIWRDGDELVCDVHDHGRIKDPLVGRERPPVDQVGGRGLWIANQLCDLVQIRSGERGTHVRMRMELS